MKLLNALIRWTHHPFSGIWISLTFAWAWPHLWLVWIPAFSLGVVNEGFNEIVQHKGQSWPTIIRDVIDFTLGGVYAMVFIWLAKG